MDPATIFQPFLALMLLTVLVWTYMYIRRIHFIRVNRVANRDLQNPEGLARIAPMGVVTPSNNLKNLFELPVIFYALLLFLYVTGRVDGTYLAAAWIFVGLRTLHSLVHCSFNHVPLRFLLYLLASVALWFMVIRVALAAF